MGDYRPKNDSLFALENTLVDSIANVNESVISELGLRRGNSNGTDDESRIKFLNSLLKNQKIEYGGSAANTACGYANLGLPASFAGSIGNDANGIGFKQSLLHSNVKPYLALREKMNGVCYVLITPDGERTFLVSMGASSDIKPEEIPDLEVANSGFFHSTAYALDSISKAFYKVLGIAKQNNVRVSFDVASANFVQKHMSDFERILPNVDILFINEDEAKVFNAGSNDELLSKLHNTYGISLVALKLGKEGSILSTKSSRTRIPPYKVDVINTNGAGDAFAAGLLYGLAKGYNLENSGKIASYYASRVVMQQPTRLNYKIPIEGITD